MMRKIIIAVIILFMSAALGVLRGEASEVETGKHLYEKKRCGMCHVIEGKGGKMASDLSHVGSERNREWLTAFLKNPKKVLPGAKMMAVRGTEAELSALVSYLLSQK